MDSELLAEARRAQGRLIDAERDADVARADFHRAVRRLHLNGASLRELAAALSLSHQRIHQIVESAGGSRRWLRSSHEGRWLGGSHEGRTRRGGHASRPEPACTFCGRDRPQGAKLIAGPHVHICDECVGVARDVISSHPLPGARFIPVHAVRGQQPPGCEPRPRMACSFCGKQVHQVDGLAASSAPAAPGSAHPAHAAIVADRPAICTECLDLCTEILAEIPPQ